MKIVFKKNYFALCFWIYSLECWYHWIYIDLRLYWSEYYKISKSKSILKLSKERFNKPRLTLSILDKKIF